MTSANSFLQNRFLNLEITPMGAEMQFLRTASGDDLLWHGDPEFWSGRAPILFPIVGRAVDDIIAVGGHTASMSQHGFARRNLFKLQEQTDTMCRHVLTETPQTHAVYPFAFALQVTHRLEGASLHVTATVTNASARPMPFGFGFHPAFCWPLPHAEDAAHHITLAAGGSPDRLELEDGILRPSPVSGPFQNGNLVLEEALFNDGALVFPNGASDLRYGVDAGPALEFTFHNLPDLALWRPAHAPFICIEPWHGTASHVGDGPQISNRPNSITLPPKEAAQFGYSVTFTKGDRMSEPGAPPIKPMQ
jgi:galactose mutarotase-like enzyme